MNENKLIEKIMAVPSVKWNISQYDGHFIMRDLGEVFIDVGKDVTVLTRSGKQVICAIHRIEKNKEAYDNMFMTISNYFINDGIERLMEDLNNDS